MSNKRIFYNDSDGNLCVIIPSDEALAEHTIEEIADKDVPSGLAYKIGTTADHPSDRDFRNAWEMSSSEMTDGTGSEHNMFLTDPAHPDYVAPEVEE